MHTETRTVKKEHASVREKITKCQNLMEKLGKKQASIVNLKDAADLSSDDCYEIVSVETENLSGIYYEDRYLPYRDTEFEKIESLHSGAETIVKKIGEIIDKLSEHIDYLIENELYYYEEEEYTVYDAEDYQ